MTGPLDRGRSLEELEGHRWPDPPADATALVRAVHEMRRRPVGTLEPHELARLIRQDVGTAWLLPLAVEILRDAAPRQAEGGWFDDDLLYAVVTGKPEIWAAAPQLARELRDTVAVLTDVSRYVRQEIETFLATVPAPGED
ncbi:contact-dependent growth inhibition system immunity protein [Streptomyces formicae]|uniref:contact-dependent growth inhibition system immunity protein n=1 Tax=Streptomyces formicae TaxID=1616117 RepID=UPI001F36331F|nr:contact-dependent growth inhibition system immunity protein [Streptomyces formicae]